MAHYPQHERKKTYFSSALKMGSTSDILPPIGSDILQLCSRRAFVFDARLSPFALEINSTSGPSASPFVDCVSTDESFSFLLFFFSALPCFLFFLSEASSPSVLSLFLFSTEPLLACDCDLKDAIALVESQGEEGNAGFGPEEGEKSRR